MDYEFTFLPRDLDFVKELFHTTYGAYVRKGTNPDRDISMNGTTIKASTDAVVNHLSPAIDRAQGLDDRGNQLIRYHFKSLNK